MTYADKLRDPRWQKKRLEIMERDGWKCLACGSSVKTLCVHHLVYRQEPWNSPNEELETLCDECHEMRESFNAAFGRSVLPTICVFDFVSMNTRLAESPLTVIPIRIGYALNWQVVANTANRRGISFDEAKRIFEESKPKT